MSKKQKITTRLPVEVLDALDCAALETGRRKNEIVEEAIDMRWRLRKPPI